MECGRSGLRGQLVTSHVPMVPDSGPETAQGLSTVVPSVPDPTKRVKNASQECAKVKKTNDSI